MTAIPPNVEAPPTLTAPGFLSGMRLALPYGASSFVYGVAFGLLAAQTGISVIEAVAMSALVFSGTAQIAVLQSWTHALSLLAIAATVLLVNVRYMLLGATLRPWVAPLGHARSTLALLSIVDGSYALGIREKQRGNSDVGVLIGAGVMSWACWVFGTAVGFFTGAAILNPRTLGLDFVVVAFCASTVAVMIGAVRDMAPALVALVVIIVCELVIPSHWSVVAAGLTAAAVGAWRYQTPKDADATPKTSAVEPAQS